jgi:hypothetical protein
MRCRPNSNVRSSGLNASNVVHAGSICRLRGQLSVHENSRKSEVHETPVNYPRLHTECSLLPLFHAYGAELLPFVTCEATVREDAEVAPPMPPRREG